MLEREPLQQLARDGELMAYQHDGFWFCMDTPRDYSSCSNDCGSGRGAVGGLGPSDAIVPGRAYRGRRVLVTGHTGFKGGWLALWLARARRRGDRLRRRRPTTPSLFDAAALASAGRVTSTATCATCDALAAVWRDGAARVVFHLAAQPLVRASYRDPLETLADQRHGHGATCSRRARREATAVARRRRHQRQVLREPRVGVRLPRGRPLGGARPLQREQGGGRDRRRRATAAASFRRAARRARRRVATARAGNVIGGGDWARRSHRARRIRALAAGQPIARAQSATRCGRGSTCSSRSAAT